MKRFTLEITTAANGSATARTPRLSGEIHQIEYVKDGVAPFDDGVDFTVTGLKSGISILTESNVNASAVRAPRQPTHSQAGVAALYASGGTAVQARIAVASDQVQIVIAQGGNAKKGTFHILVA